MIDWLLGTLIATSALIFIVLLIREPVRRQFGARVAYGLWLIPGARLLMPTLTQTVERTVPDSTPIQPFVPAVAAEPKLLASVAAPDSSLIEQRRSGRGDRCQQFRLSGDRRHKRLDRRAVGHSPLDRLGQGRH